MASAAVVHAVAADDFCVATSPGRRSFSRERLSLVIRGSEESVRRVRRVKTENVIHGEFSSTEGFVCAKQQENKTILAVDIRGRDFEGGHIRGSVNIPEDLFLDKVDQLAKTLPVQCRSIIMVSMGGCEAAERCADIMSRSVSGRVDCAFLVGGFRGVLEAGDTSGIDCFVQDNWASTDEGRVHKSELAAFAF
jgi:rhodanese-related sulfurtransferase